MNETREPRQLFTVRVSWKGFEMSNAYSDLDMAKRIAVLAAQFDGASVVLTMAPRCTCPQWALPYVETKGHTIYCPVEFVKPGVLTDGTVII